MKLKLLSDTEYTIHRSIHGDMLGNVGGKISHDTSSFTLIHINDILWNTISNTTSQAISTSAWDKWFINEN